MRRTLAALTLTLAIPSLAFAHVGVRPRESKPGAEERYSVRVPTEGAVATTSVRFEIPEGVTVLEVEKMGGETFEVEKKGDRIVAIAGNAIFPSRSPRTSSFERAILRAAPRSRGRRISTSPMARTPHGWSRQVASAQAP